MGIKRPKHSLVLEKRIITEAMLYLSHDDETYVSVARKMRVSAATIYRDLAIKLESLDKALYNDVRKKARFNSRVALIRAREAKKRLRKIRNRKNECTHESHKK